MGGSIYCVSQLVDPPSLLSFDHNRSVSRTDQNPQGPAGKKKLLECIPTQEWNIRAKR